MANFWDDLGNTLTRKAKGLSSRAENLYEIQKIRNKLSAQERMTCLLYTSPSPRD